MCLISAEVLVKRLRGDTTTEPLAEPAAAVEPATWVEPVETAGSRVEPHESKDPR
jgi:hypothetical protein